VGQELLILKVSLSHSAAAPCGARASHSQGFTTTLSSSSLWGKGFLFSRFHYHTQQPPVGQRLLILMVSLSHSGAPCGAKASHSQGFTITLSSSPLWGKGFSFSRFHYHTQQQPLVGQGLLILNVSLSHSAGLIWKSSFLNKLNSMEQSSS
jgi:hypothetical protein